MARPRTARRYGNVVYFPPSAGLDMTPALRELIDSQHPSVPYVTTRVLAERMRGSDVQDPAVIDRCIANGKADHAQAVLDGVA